MELMFMYEVKRRHSSQCDLNEDPDFSLPLHTIHNPISLPLLLIASSHKQCMSQR